MESNGVTARKPKRIFHRRKQDPAAVNPMHRSICAAYERSYAFADKQDLPVTVPFNPAQDFFRLFQEEDSRASDNGVFTNEAEANFGIVRERQHGYAYRTKARVLRRLYRGEEEAE